MRIVSILILVFLFTGCSSAERDLNLDERVSGWNRIVEKEIPIGSNATDVFDWAKSKGIPINEYRNEAKLIAILEVVDDPSVVCSHWSILLSAVLTDQKMESYKIEKQGTCL